MSGGRGGAAGGFATPPQHLQTMLLASFIQLVARPGWSPREASDCGTQVAHDTDGRALETGEPVTGRPRGESPRRNRWRVAIRSDGRHALLTVGMGLVESGSAARCVPGGR